MAAYATTLLADLTFLHDLLNDRRPHTSAGFENYKVACAFCAVYLSANARSIAAIIHHVYRRSEAELKASDPYPHDEAWRHSHRRSAELALAINDKPPAFGIEEDGINMLRRTIRIAEALNVSPGLFGFTLFLSPAQECFKTLERAGCLGFLFMHEDGSDHQ
ncbi:MAG TPA: hypothetical protein VF789_04820 [Thermoanaerobaculia bacterium]